MRGSADELDGHWKPAAWTVRQTARESQGKVKLRLRAPRTSTESDANGVLLLDKVATAKNSESERGTNPASMNSKSNGNGETEEVKHVGKQHDNETENNNNTENGQARLEHRQYQKTSKPNKRAKKWTSEKNKWQPSESWISKTGKTDATHYYTMYTEIYTS